MEIYCPGFHLSKLGNYVVGWSPINPPNTYMYSLRTTCIYMRISHIICTLRTHVHPSIHIEGCGLRESYVRTLQPYHACAAIQSSYAELENLVLLDARYGPVLGFHTCFNPLNAETRNRTSARMALICALHGSYRLSRLFIFIA